MWNDLDRLFECKRKCLERAAMEEAQEDVHRGQGGETLVL